MQGSLSREAILRGVPVFEHVTRVRFADSVAGGRMYHPRMLELMHDAYEELLAEAGTPLPLVLRERRWGAPLSHAEVELLAPVAYGDALSVAITAALVQKSRVTFGYRVTALADGEVVALGRTVHAFVDLATFQRIELPEAIAALVERFGSAPVAEEAAGPAIAALSREALKSAEPLSTAHVEVNYDDVDAAGFVFFAQQASYLHRAYCELRRREGKKIEEYGRASDAPRILSTELDFLRPLKVGDRADVHVVAVHHQEGLTTVGFRIVSAPGGETVAIGTLAHEAFGASAGPQ